MLPEGITIEYKRQYTDECKKEILAFANTEGGKLFIGINDDGSIIGVENPDETMSQLANAIRDSIRPDVTIFTSCRIQTIEGKPVVCMDVQRGTARPYYLKGKGLRPEGVYIRQGASSVPASEAAIRQMIKETDGDSYEDMRALNQNLTFDYTGKEFQEAGLAFGDSQKRTLNIVRDDGTYSNLGLLLSEQCVHTIKLAEFEGIVKTTFRDRHEFSGALLQQMNEAYTMLDRFNRISARTEGLKRIDEREYPPEAIREALANVIVHRDYAYNSSTQISMFDNRIEMISIGGLVKGITIDDIMLGVSVLRNEKLANVFYRLHLIEAYGTGIPKMFESYRDYDIEPEIALSDNAFKITLPNTQVRSRERSLGQSELSKNEERVLSLFETHDRLIRKDVQDALEISQTTAITLLRNMVDKGFLKQIGMGKATHYELAQ